MVDSLLAVAVRGKVDIKKNQEKYFMRDFQAGMDFSVAILWYQQKFWSGIVSESKEAQMLYLAFLFLGLAVMLFRK